MDIVEIGINYRNDEQNGQLKMKNESLQNFFNFWSYKELQDIEKILVPIP